MFPDRGADHVPFVPVCYLRCFFLLVFLFWHFYFCLKCLQPCASGIAGFQTTEACYNDAIKLLNERFGDTFRIGLDDLFKLKSVHVRSSSDRLGSHRLFDFVQRRVRGLRALQVSRITYGSVLVEISL